MTRKCLPSSNNHTPVSLAIPIRKKKYLDSRICATRYKGVSIAGKTEACDIIARFMRLLNVNVRAASPTRFHVPDLRRQLRWWVSAELETAMIKCFWGWKELAALKLIKNTNGAKKQTISLLSLKTVYGSVKQQYWPGWNHQQDHPQHNCHLGPKRTMWLQRALVWQALALWPIQPALVSEMHRSKNGALNYKELEQVKAIIIMMLNLYNRVIPHTRDRVKTEEDESFTCFWVLKFVTSQILRDPSSEEVSAVWRSLGCQCPPVRPEIWPLVFFKSRIYMSPFTNSPNVNPSLSYIFAVAEPVIAINWSAVGDQLRARSWWPSLGSIWRKERSWAFIPWKSYMRTV